MTPQEIQALINAKIAGQGSAVDVGGALPQILSGILELATSGPQVVNIPKLGVLEQEDVNIINDAFTVKYNGALYNYQAFGYDDFASALKLESGLTLKKISRVFVNEWTTDDTGSMESTQLLALLECEDGQGNEVYYFELLAL